MADNVNILDAAGAAVPVATDEVGGVEYQRVKLTLGTEGAADMDLDSGQQTMANRSACCHCFRSDIHPRHQCWHLRGAGCPERGTSWCRQ